MQTASKTVHISLIKYYNSSELSSSLGTFSIPITKHPQANASNVFHIPANDFNGRNALVALFEPLIS